MVIGKSDKIIDLIRHEFGHILEYRQPFVGMGGFYKVIAPESVASNAFGSTFANSYWTETWANHLSGNYFGAGFSDIIKYPSQPLSNFNFAKFLTLNAGDVIPMRPLIIKF